jgi:hypothetical protein
MKVVVHNKFSLRLEMQCSAHPFASGSRTNAGELSMPRNARSAWDICDLYWLP